jgi:Tfp pilus assembly protein PilV
MKTKLLSFKKGLTLVEVVIASAIILAAVLSLLGVHSLYLKIALSSGQTVKATYLLEESLEAVRFLRDSSWDANIATLTLGTNYGVVWNGALWQLNSSNKWVDNFERTVTLSAVYRDSSDDIVSSGGTLDTDTKLVVASVSWQSAGATTTRSISTYITNLE